MTAAPCFPPNPILAHWHTLAHRGVCQGEPVCQLSAHAGVPRVAMLGFENRCGKAAQSTRSDGAVSERGKRSHLKLVFGIDWVLMYGTVDSIEMY